MSHHKRTPAELIAIVRQVLAEADGKAQPRPSISAARVRYWAFRINQADDPLAACLVIGELMREAGVEVRE